MLLQAEGVVNDSSISAALSRPPSPDKLNHISTRSVPFLYHWPVDCELSTFTGEGVLRLPAIAVAIIPSALWLWWFARKAGQREAAYLTLSWLFLLGTLAAGLAALVEVASTRALAWLCAGLPSALPATAAATVEAGLIEEAAKLLVVLGFALYAGRPRSSGQGAIWAVAAGVGFAAVENFLFVSREGMAVLVLRGPLSTLAHAIFAALWGSALAASVAADGRILWRPLVGGLLTAALAHAVFNLVAAVAAASSSAAVAFLELPLLVLLYYFACLRAWSRSAQMSSTSSMPTETRTSPSPMPTA